MCACLAVVWRFVSMCACLAAVCLAVCLYVCLSMLSRALKILTDVIRNLLQIVFLFFLFNYYAPVSRVRALFFFYLSLQIVFYLIFLFISLLRTSLALARSLFLLSLSVVEFWACAAGSVHRYMHE
jgi:hypothetical protein